MKKITSKEGIALISLVLMIIVLLMLSGLITYASYDIINESKKITFANDTATIYDAVEEYYMVNGTIPVLEGGIEINYDAYISSITGDVYLSALSEEVSNNGDENAIFYEIDMSKIGIKDIKYGVKENAKDLFLISNISHNIYYYSGYKIKNNVYFSNTSILSK